MSCNLNTTICPRCGHYAFNRDDITEVIEFKEYIKSIRNNYQYDHSDHKFAKVRCNLCGGIYAAWLKEDSWDGKLNVIDLSYWYTFNDECYPVQDDKYKGYQVSCRDMESCEQCQIIKKAYDAKRKYLMDTKCAVCGNTQECLFFNAGKATSFVNGISKPLLETEGGKKIAGILHGMGIYRQLSELESCDGSMPWRKK